MRQLILVEERSDPGENGAVFPPVQVKKKHFVNIVYICSFLTIRLFCHINRIYNIIMLVLKLNSSKSCFSGLDLDFYN